VITNLENIFYSVYNRTQSQQCSTRPLTTLVVFMLLYFPGEPQANYFWTECILPLNRGKTRCGWVVLCQIQHIYRARGRTALSQSSELQSSITWTKGVDWWPTRGKTSIHSQNFILNWLSKHKCHAEQLELRRLVFYDNTFCTLGDGFHIIACWKVTWNTDNSLLLSMTDSLSNNNSVEQTSVQLFAREKHLFSSNIVVHETEYRLFNILFNKIRWNGQKCKSDTHIHGPKIKKNALTECIWCLPVSIHLLLCEFWHMAQ